MREPMTAIPPPWHPLVVLILGLAAGCSAATTTDSTATGASPSSRSNATATGATRAPTRRDVRRNRAPVIVSVSGPSSVVAGDTVILNIEIEQLAQGADARLKVELPRGATLVDGELNESLTSDVAAIFRQIVVQLPNGVPQEDVRVVVDSTGINFGAHAQARYRFGRSAPSLPAPPRVGTPLRVHGVSLGASIPLT